MMTKHEAIGYVSSLDNKAPVTRHAVTSTAMSITKLATVAIGMHDLTFDSHSIQDLDALAEAMLLFDVQGKRAKTWKRERD